MVVEGPQQDAQAEGQECGSGEIDAFDTVPEQQAVAGQAPGFELLESEDFHSRDDDPADNPEECCNGHEHTKGHPPSPCLTNGTANGSA